MRRFHGLRRAAGERAQTGGRTVEATAQALVRTDRHARQVDQAVGPLRGYGDRPQDSNSCRRPWNAGLENETVSKTGASRAAWNRGSPAVAPHRRSSESTNVDSNSCKETGARQGLAALITIEKNRCIPARTPEAHSPPLAALFWEMAGTISGTILGTAGFPVTQSLSYT